MKLEQSFEVQAPADRVWALLTDLASVAPCLPGAQLSDAGEDGSYAGTFTVKLGPTTASYRGKIRFEERDDEARRAMMYASGQDKRGQGGATATMVTTVAGDERRSEVTVATDLLITGKLARFGRGGMIEDISRRLLGDFARCLQAELTGPGEAAAPEPTAQAVAAPEPTAEPAPAPGGAPSPSASEPPGTGGSPPPAPAAAAPAPTAAPLRSSGPAPGPWPERPAAANTISGVALVIGALPGVLRRNAPAIGGTLVAVVVLLRWRRRRRR
jgi:carbon monoxide dehydrogenase subunit G